MDLGGNTSCHADFMALKTWSKLVPAFLNESIISHLPSISSTFVNNSRIDMPNLLEVDSNSLNAEICSSVKPFALNSASDKAINISTVLAFAALSFSDVSVAVS